MPVTHGSAEGHSSRPGLPDDGGTMTDLMVGALLHDIGKVVYRGSSDKGNHSQLGADFIRTEVAPRNAWFEGEHGRRVVEQIRHHHASEMTPARLSPDSLAFITYFADNISAGMDRKNEGDEGQARYFDRKLKLQRVFNRLNGRHDHNTVEHEDYNAIRERIKENLVAMGDAVEVNSLLNLLEATTSAVPSSTDTRQVADVSLYDHAKTTAAAAACIYHYLRERGVSDYRAALFGRDGSSRYYAEPMFLLYSCDMSGIQDFIYSISGDKALKQLRARSLYLEMLLEHIADELLERLGLSRANLLYTGGGHAYLLLPNTAAVKGELGAFEGELRAWFLRHYRTDLYLASASVACSADDLSNNGPDKRRYPGLYQAISRKLSEKKAARYSAQDIRELNFGQQDSYDHGRECKECHRSDLAVDDGGRCPLCNAFADISAKLARDDVFVVRECGDGDALVGDADGLALPFGRQLVVYSRKGYEQERPAAVRVYTKNGWDTGLRYATHIWMGDYTAPTDGLGISAYAKADKAATLLPGESGEKLGIERLGVLRADVDDLGMTFMNGIPDELASISRTSTLSRALSYFFKYKINEVLQARGYQAQIIYSGGDDLFILGNWSDIIYAALDIRRALDAFTGNGSLTLSAGIGMFDAKYPVARMARRTGELEDAAKLYRADDGSGKTKDAVALWSEDNVFSWDDFEHIVIPRLNEVREAFEGNEKGKAFIYKLVSLLRNYDDAASAPRLAYLLARSFEKDGGGGNETSRKFYEQAQDGKQRRCLTAALEWYVYSIRERG